KLGRCVAVHEIREYHYKRSTMIACAKKVERAQVAWLNHLRLEAVESLHQPVDLVAAFSRREVADDLSREGDQSNVVSARRRYIRDRKRGVYGVVELCKLSDASGHQSSGVEHHYDVLASLDRVLASDHLSSPRGRGP